ncbi:MAG: NERD domain-containing protein [Xanthomonadales bacterium]|jgi:hypothetical protein|nr:NERD domain-containing protein [Xanthomonadales bacterium]
MTSGFMITAVVAIGVALALIAAAIGALTRSAKFKGFTGERLTREALRRGLDAHDYRVLNDVTLPGRFGATQIDHVIISHFGIFVLETKHLFGWIFARRGARHWTQSLGPKKSVRFQNPLRQNHAHVKALEAVTGLDSKAFQPLVVMTGRATFKTPVPPRVVLIADLVDEIRRHVVVWLSQEQMAAAQAAIEAARLKPDHKSGRKTNRAHVAGLQARFGGGARPPRVLAGLRVAALVLLGAFVWGSLGVWHSAMDEVERVVVSGEDKELVANEPPGAEVDVPRAAEVQTAVTTLEPERELESLSGPVPQPRVEVAETPPLPLVRPPAAIPESPPMMVIEPTAPEAAGGKLATAPKSSPRERFVSPAARRQQFEETLDCTVTGTFKDCSCTMESGAKVLVGYQRCRELARYQGVVWVSRPE